ENAIRKAFDPSEIDRYLEIFRARHRGVEIKVLVALEQIEMLIDLVDPEMRDYEPKLWKGAQNSFCSRDTAHRIGVDAITGHRARLSPGVHHRNCAERLAFAEHIHRARLVDRNALHVTMQLDAAKIMHFDGFTHNLPRIGFTR